MSEEKEKSPKEYYEVKCPKCDEIITKIFDNGFGGNYIKCPKCNADVSLYSLFSYNMWLADNGKCIKSEKRPVKIKPNKTINKSNISTIFENILGQYGYQKIDDEESENNRIFTFLKQNEDYIEDEENEEFPNSRLNFNLLNIASVDRALVLQAHFKALLELTDLDRKEALEIIKTLINNDMLF